MCRVHINIEDSWATLVCKAHPPAITEQVFLVLGWQDWLGRYYIALLLVSLFYPESMCSWSQIQLAKPLQPYLWFNNCFSFSVDLTFLFISSTVTKAAHPTPIFLEARSHSRGKDTLSRFSRPWAGKGMHFTWVNATVGFLLLGWQKKITSYLIISSPISSSPKISLLPLCTTFPHLSLSLYSFILCILFINTWKNPIKYLAQWLADEKCFVIIIVLINILW